MNNKGFAITGIIYSILILFLVIITLMLFNLQNRKTILDELKADAVDAVESDNNYGYLLNEVNTIQTKIGTTDISGLGDGTITGNVYELNNGLNITYNSDDDYIYINGQKWKRANLQNFSIIDGTSVCDNFITDSYENASSYPLGGSYSMGETGAVITAPSGNGSRYIGALVDLTDYSSIKFEYQIGGLSYVDSIDITDVTGERYLLVGCTSAGGVFHWRVNLQYTYTNFYNNDGGAFVSKEFNTTAGQVLITKLYLE